LNRERDAKLGGGEDDHGQAPVLARIGRPLSKI